MGKSLRHSADLVAPDTITYFDRPGAKPVPVKQLTRQLVESRKHGDGVVAANSSAKTISQTGSGK